MTYFTTSCIFFPCFSVILVDACSKHRDRRSRRIRVFDGFFSTVFKYARPFRANNKREKVVNLQTLASTYRVYGKIAIHILKQRARFLKSKASSTFRAKSPGI